MSKLLFNNDWYFLKTPLGTEPVDIQGREAEFQAVELPHDWLIYNVKNLYEDSCGWYRKELSAELKNHECVILRFDGVYMDSTLYVNGEKVGDWKYGYSAFDMDVTKYLTGKDDVLLLQVRHQAPNSRWYSGAGIYRNVWLQTGDGAWLVGDGTYVHIKPCDNSAGGQHFYVEIETEVAGSEAESAVVRYSLHKDRRQVRELGTASVAGCEETVLSGTAVNVRGRAKLNFVMENPELWDIEAPNCYDLHVELCLPMERKAERVGWSDGTEEKTENTKDTEFFIQDSQCITIGFRTMDYDPNTGFYLNGRNVKVHGVCEHHDFGCIGSVYNDAAMIRKFNILRGMGVNALRTSHNMPAAELMELADRMGFLVLDEAFDMWESCKTPYDYGRFFKEWAKRDVTGWIRRDRNHPSVMLWSIGNEIYDTHRDVHGQEITRYLIDYVREHDPKENARITIGSNYMPWENARMCADIVKMAGYNYGEKYYDEHHNTYPDWVIYGSETASIVQSRGIYHFPLSQSILADEDLQCSALGNSSTSWGAKSIEKCITDDRDATYAFGQFLWTGFDYIGEPTPYHTKNSYFGQVDTAGFVKDSYYIFGGAWRKPETGTVLHLFPYWDFNPGQSVDVRAATNAPCVELFVNGRSYGKQEIDHARGRKLLGDWKVPYEPGTITVVAYDAEGREIGRDSRSSFKDSKKIILEADRKVLRADNKDLSFITIETVDEDGHPVENAVDYVEVQVSGVGRLLGLDNGDSTDDEEYKCNVRKLFSGKLLAVVGTTHEAGEIEVTVTGRGLESASIKLTTEDVGAERLAFLDRCVISSKKPEDYHVPVRKVELRAISGEESACNTVPDAQAGVGLHRISKALRFAPECRELFVQAEIFPADATDKELIFKVVNDAGIDINFAKVEETAVAGNVHTAKITAMGDGDFRLRCMSKSNTSHVTVISQLECRAEGLGQAFLNPYEGISAGLYSEVIGEVTNGNEKGIATSRDGVSGAVYKAIDFGSYGSDEITLPVFALSDDVYPIELWLGHPEEGGRLLSLLEYQKPSEWNVYQEETFKLPERIKGVATIGLLLRNQKIHLKGFRFLKQEKAFGRLYAGECDRVYGDEFVHSGNDINGIGNNVTLEYEGMDFGAGGAGGILICGRTSLGTNTIHIHFTDERGERVNRIIEFKGTEENCSHEQYFEIEPLRGSGKVEFLFLPGSSFDFSYFRFCKLQ